jgi:amino acid transporter
MIGCDSTLSAEVAGLSRRLIERLSLPEAIGLSLSVIAPTLTAAFNITLVVQAAGAAAPLTFAIGTIAVGLVALSFIAFSRRVSHAGSAYAYVTHTFGRRLGFVAGWALLLTYFGFATGCAALVGSFTAAVLQRLGLDIGGAWVLVGALAVLLAWWLAFRDMRLAGRLMLALEGVAVAGTLVLCARILTQTHPTMAQSLASFRPSADFGGWSGIGFGLVFTVLSFAGFEGAATLGEETVNPRRNIPVAMFSTVLGAGAFFVFVAYCEVIGFGPARVHELAASAAPLNDLALRYGSPSLALLLDLATATCAFSGVLGGLSAAARVLFALGRVGLAPTLAEVHDRHGTPARAIIWAALAIGASFLVWAPLTGAGNYYSYASTTGTLALILVYIAVGGAEMVEAWRDGRPLWSAICVIGPVVLLWSLYRTVYPAPEFPNNLWPYLAILWIVAAFVVMWWRPKVARGPLPEAMQREFR